MNLTNDLTAERKLEALVQRTRIIPGIMQRNWGGWYRHDYVFIDDQKLDGYIQVQRKPKRQERRSTVYSNATVDGTNIQWLLKCNGLA